MTADLLRLAPDDDVAIARRALTAGESLDGGPVARQDIPPGHKVALRDLPSGATVHKYGHVIGVTTREVAAGEHVHTHNLAFVEDADDGDTGSTGRIAALPDDLRRTFLGYRRADGRVGTRNYIAVLTTVNCSATVARRIVRLTDDAVREAGSGPGGGSTGGGVDGVVALTHGTGCGMASRGEGWDLLQRTLSGYARHPNIGGVLVLGLGCEVNEVSGLASRLELPPGVPVATSTIQDAGGTAAAIEAGAGIVRELAQQAASARRSEVGVEHLVLGLQCGGSDAWSGLTANPALGAASDLLVAAGATSILSETPEIYGAEQLLARRAVTPEVARDLLERIAWWRSYTAAQGTSLDGNPSPGNKEGGITTILEKSLGAVAKGGHSPLSAVVRYADPVPGPGLVFMDTPGYDPVSVTGQVAGGATLICFTTGRGSVFGSRPAPTVKLSTNAQTARFMADDIDLDCSPVIESGVPVAEMGRQVYDLLLRVASGEASRSEALGLGGEELVPWQVGAVL